MERHTIFRGNIIKYNIFFLLFLSAISCQKKDTPVALVDYNGTYVGTMKGELFPPNFPITMGTKFSESGEFVITANEIDGLIDGFDDLPAKFEFARDDRSAFGVLEYRDTGELRISASGRFKGDTLEIAAGYHYTDRSRSSFRFLGVKK